MRTPLAAPEHVTTNPDDHVLATAKADEMLSPFTSRKASNVRAEGWPSSVSAFWFHETDMDEIRFFSRGSAIVLVYFAESVVLIPALATAEASNLCSSAPVLCRQCRKKFDDAADANFDRLINPVIESEHVARAQIEKVFHGHRRAM